MADEATVSEVSTALLDRRLYRVPDAAGLLAIPPSTLSWWLHGRVTSSGREYLPALRSQRNNDRTVTWGEFIEASLLKQLRAAGVKLDAIRTFARAVRLAKGWTYPLARHDLYVGESRQLVYEAQLLADIPDGAALVVAGKEYGRGQQILTNGQALDAFLESIEFADDIPVAYHPDIDASHVVCDARRRFGEPQVAGVPTEALWELVEAGESIEAVAQNFALDVTLVREAVGFERRRHSEARAA